MSYDPASIARLAVTGTYVALLVGAVSMFTPVQRTGRGRLLVLTFVAMMYASGVGVYWPPGAIPGGILLAASLSLFFWGAFSIRGKFFSYVGSQDAPEFVFQGGPFGYVRHPFYVSYLLAHTGTLVLFPHWMPAAAWAVAIVATNQAAAFEEGKFANGALAEEYRDYATRTGRFLPRF